LYDPNNLEYHEPPVSSETSDQGCVSPWESRLRSVADTLEAMAGNFHVQRAPESPTSSMSKISAGPEKDALLLKKANR